MQLTHSVNFVSNFFPATQKLHEGLAWVFWFWYLPVGQGEQVKVLVRVPMEQLRSPNPSYPAEHEGVHVDPDRRIDGQFPEPPLVGGVLALLQGMV